MARQVLENGVVLPAEYSDDWYDDMTSNLTKLDDVIGSDSEKLSSADVGAAALSNNYNDLDNLPTIPTVNDATLTIQKNGVDVQTFTANASSNVTANITVPTKTSDITNDSNFVDTSNSAVASGITSAKVTSYDTHIADTDIHVTTADKTKWNNGVSQSYVFRYSSTALVASSTNSNTLLDNTDNLKVGDKVIDSSGVLFSITAIDTENSTFTIGTALIDLAQDSDVMHLSGNESASGNKNFKGLITTIPDETLWPATTNTTADITSLGGSSIHVEYKSSGKLTDLSGGAWTVVELGEGCFFFRTNNGADIRFKHFPTNSVNRIYVVNGANRHINDLIPDQDNTRDVGSNSLRWATFNGLNPSALSLPDLDNGIDISSYITVNGGNKESFYTPPANGWVSVRLSRTSGSFAVLLNQGGMASSGRDITSESGIKTADAMLPVVGGVQVSINSALADSVVSAYFYPCLGNV